MTTSGPPIDQIKAAMQSQWMAGDFGVVARTISGAAEDFVQRLRLPAGSRVLDIACGTGNVTLPLARAGCTATGVDIAPNLLVQARERAAEEGLAIRFDEGDAENLPYPDASFDAVVTMFGAMFAPRPALVASEMARVLRPGGRLGMANWTPEGFSGQMFRIGGRHAPPPPGIPPPVLWGDATVVPERLGAAFREIRTELVPLNFDLPVPPAGAVNFFRQYFGPTKTAFERMNPEQQAAFAAELEALWAGANVSPTPEEKTLVRNEYLAVEAVKV